MNTKLSAVKNKSVSFAKHVHRNRAKYAALTTAAGFLGLMARNAKGYNEFLEKHNLLDEYYQFEENE